MNFNKSFDSFDALFTTVGNDLMNISTSNSDAAEFISSPRGQEIKEVINASLALTNPRNRLLAVEERKFSLEYLAAELVWYFSGDNTVRWIGRHASFWNSIQNDDGTLNSAYGDRIFNRGQRDLTYPYKKNGQWEMVLREFRKDPDSRRAVIHIRDVDDGFDASDVPCTLTLQFILRDNDLHMITNMRSNDLVLGTCYDIPFFTLLQEIMAIDLGVNVGSYFHNAGSLHVYSRHYKMLENMKGVTANTRLTDGLLADDNMNQSMNPLSDNHNISNVRSDAIILRDWDARSLVELSNRYKRNPEYLIKGFDKSLQMAHEMLQTDLMKDCATLLVSSYLRKLSKELSSEILAQHRKEVCDKNVFDPSMRSCLRK